MSRLVVIDGLDGSGKTTQFELLCEYLSSRGTSYKQICFPDYKEPSSALVKMYLAGEFGSSPDSVNPYAASAFYAVDRYASYKRFWESDYKAGVLILAARYTTSNVIHQMSKLPREKWDGYLSWLEDFEYGLLELPRPDVVVFLDMPLEVSQRLLINRYKGDSERRDIHERDKEYLKRCRESALYAAEKLGWQVIPCAQNGEPLPEKEISQTLIKLTGV
ncbi:MAG TPA: thymidylate kinase [Candidatus Avimonas sp.]|nr:thymidylate kinase [Clostridiales bacterium]HPU58920.1 thymidylate kinase [Candidatus Avimonas sp.]